MKCVNCGREIIFQEAPGIEADYWYHPDGSTVWCWDASLAPVPIDRAHEQATPR